VDGVPNMHEKICSIVKRANPAKVILYCADTRGIADL
jgi:hypothetical protein